MSLTKLLSLPAGLGLILCAGLAFAAGDAGLPAPKPPAKPLVDTSPRCETATVNQCRTACERRKFEPQPGKTQDQMANACKQDCIRGC